MAVSEDTALAITATPSTPPGRSAPSASDDAASARDADVPTLVAPSSASPTSGRERMRDIRAGDRVGDYLVTGKLGEGGFGVVFEATHALLGRKAALKILHARLDNDPETLSRFLNEARVVNRIRHPNIIDVFAFGQLEDGRPYSVMECLDGESLETRLRDRGRLDLDEALPILKSLARALDLAHAAGVVHRDLKPENVFLARMPSDDGAPWIEVPKLLDFGIAKLASDLLTTHKTRTGTPIGTPQYMSPEQCRGRNVDGRSDVYSLGILSFELLTGRLPFECNSVLDMLNAHISEPPIRPSLLCPTLSKRVDAAVLAMLGKEPSVRPISASLAIAAMEDPSALVTPLHTTPRPAARDVRLRTTPRDPRGRTPEGTVLPAPSDAPPRETRASRARDRRIAVLSTLMVAIAATAGFALRGREPQSVAALPSVSLDVVAVDATARSSASPSASGTTTTSLPQVRPSVQAVTIRFALTPSSARVMRDGLPLADARLVVTPGDPPAEIDVAAPGYVSRHLTLRPTADETQTIVLSPLPPAASKSSAIVVPEALENPYR